MANDKQNKQRRFYLDGYAQHPEWYTWHYEMLKKLKDIDEGRPKGPTNVTNALFIGSTAELSKILKQQYKNEDIQAV